MTVEVSMVSERVTPGGYHMLRHVQTCLLTRLTRKKRRRRIRRRRKNDENRKKEEENYNENRQVQISVCPEVATGNGQERWRWVDFVGGGELNIFFVVVVNWVEKKEIEKEREQESKEKK